MHPQSHHFVHRPSSGFPIEENGIQPNMSARQRHRYARASQRNIKALLAAALVLAILIRGWYCTKKQSIESAAMKECLSPESSNEDTEDSKSSVGALDPTPEPEPEMPQPTKPAVPEKKIHEMKLEPKEYERPEGTDVDWAKVWKEGSTSATNNMAGYQSPETFFDRNTRNMFEKIISLGGTMELRRPSSTAGEGIVTFMITTTPEPWLTEEELEAHPLGPLRKQLCPLAAEFVEDAIKELMASSNAFTAYNPFKEIDLDGYGKILVQLLPSDVRAPQEEAAEEIETALRTGRGVLICHLPEVDIAVALNQPDGIDEAEPILDENFDELDLFRQKLEETVEDFVERTVRNSNNYKVLRITQSLGVRKTTVVSLYGMAK
ncbi:hypothetical protein, conserved [Eimeria praecox]|uniref:Uncharacterized protein n=1 Tax=Eimeria praecox TaxID=51316 RepID=U6H2J6_9EIME|nr:hypothetical protein, conserved [Eimeria praecox]